MDLVAIGVSANGIGAIQSIFGTLPRDFPAAVVLVMHHSPLSPARANRSCAAARVGR
jgi:chemotaxis response regulator CheB